MGKRILIWVWGAFVLCAVGWPAWSAPQLSDEQRELLADSTTDGDNVIDQRPGLYVLLRNAADWQADDFSGDPGVKSAPEPDYAYLRDEPSSVRGDVFSVTGKLVQADRFPTTDNFDRDALMRAGDPAWGDQLTRWIIATDPSDPASTVIVFFNDPRGQIKAPDIPSDLRDAPTVRVAARFFKLWTIASADGGTFTYPTFVGGAYEVTATPSASTRTSSPFRTLIILAIVVFTGGYFAVRYLLNRSGTGGSLTRARLDAIRQQRERYEDDSDDDDDDEPLPEDPVAALDELRKRHEIDQQEERS